MKKEENNGFYGKLLTTYQVVQQVEAETRAEVKKKIKEWSYEAMQDEGGRQSTEQPNTFHSNAPWNEGYNQALEDILEFIENL